MRTTSLTLAAALLLSGCLRDLQQQVDTLRGQLYLVATNALCHPDVQHLVKAVSKACAHQSVCVDPRIGFLISEVDPGGRFITLMSTQPYAVFYPEPRRSALDEAQTRRLVQLAQPPWLPSTRFLVVANIDKGGNIAQAKHHAEQVLQVLTQLEFAGFRGQHVPKDHALGWVLRFKLQQDEHLRPIDRPTRGAGIDSSVWVFRTDCRTDDDPVGRGS